jgi:hypothetical protein
MGLRDGGGGTRFGFGGMRCAFPPYGLYGLAQPPAARTRTTVQPLHLGLTITHQHVDEECLDLSAVARVRCVLVVQEGLDAEGLQTPM